MPWRPSPRRTAHEKGPPPWPRILCDFNAFPAALVAPQTLFQIVWVGLRTAWDAHCRKQAEVTLYFNAFLSGRAAQYNHMNVTSSFSLLHISRRTFNLVLDLSSEIPVSLIAISPEIKSRSIGDSVPREVLVILSCLCTHEDLNACF